MDKSPMSWGEFLLVGWVLGGDLLEGLLGLGVMFLVGEGEKEALNLECRFR